MRTKQGIPRRAPAREMSRVSIIKIDFSTGLLEDHKIIIVKAPTSRDK